MGNRKKAYVPKAFESTGVSGDTSANIYESMLKSRAFQDLTKNQRLLYLYMKAQYYGKRKPERDFPNIEQFQGMEFFYFNLSLAERYGLYQKGNRKQFYDDIKAIIEHGFIRVVSNGRSTKSKSIYQFISKWQIWKDSS